MVKQPDYFVTSIRYLGKFLHHRHLLLEQFLHATSVKSVTAPTIQSEEILLGEKAIMYVFKLEGAVGIWTQPLHWPRVEMLVQLCEPVEDTIG